MVEDGIQETSAMLINYQNAWVPSFPFYLLNNRINLPV